MTVVRVSKDKNHPYVILNKEFLNDGKISFKLKGFLAYCLSKPDEWTHHVTYISSIMKESATTIYSIIKEGIVNGYIEKHQSNEKGRFGRVEYVIHETKLKKCLPLREKSHAHNCTLLSNEEELCKEREREKEEVPSTSKKDSPSAQTPALFFFKFKRVKMHMKDYDKLVEDFKQPKVDEMLERLEEYADINPKRFKVYANHATVIRKWIREDGTKGPKKAENRIKEVQEYIQSHPKKEVLQKAKTDGKIEIHANRIEKLGVFNGSSHEDQYIKFTDHNAKERIDQLIRQMRS